MSEKLSERGNASSTPAPGQPQQQQASKTVRLYHIGKTSQQPTDPDYQNRQRQASIHSNSLMQSFYNQYQTPFQYQNQQMQYGYSQTSLLGSSIRGLNGQPFDNENFIIYDKKNKCYYKIEDDDGEEDSDEESDETEEETEEEETEEESEEEESEEEEEESEEESEAESGEETPRPEQLKQAQSQGTARTALASSSSSKDLATKSTTSVGSDAEIRKSTLLKNHPIKGTIKKVVEESDKMEIVDDADYKIVSPPTAKSRRSSKSSFKSAENDNNTKPGEEKDKSEYNKSAHSLMSTETAVEKTKRNSSSNDDEDRQPEQEEVDVEGETKGSRSLIKSESADATSQKQDLSDDEVIKSNSSKIFEADQEAVEMDEESLAEAERKDTGSKTVLDDGNSESTSEEREAGKDDAQTGEEKEGGKDEAESDDADLRSTGEEKEVGKDDAQTGEEKEGGKDEIESDNADLRSTGEEKEGGKDEAETGEAGLESTGEEKEGCKDEAGLESTGKEREGESYTTATNLEGKSSDAAKKPTKPTKTKQLKSKSIGAISSAKSDDLSSKSPKKKERVSTNNLGRTDKSGVAVDKKSPGKKEKKLIVPAISIKAADIEKEAVSPEIKANNVYSIRKDEVDSNKDEPDRNEIETGLDSKSMCNSSRSLTKQIISDVRDSIEPTQELNSEVRQEKSLKDSQESDAEAEQEANSKQRSVEVIMNMITY